MTDAEILIKKAKQLKLTCVESNLTEILNQKSLYENLLQFFKWEEEHRTGKKLEMRMKGTRLHKYRSDAPIAEFDWQWPEKIEGLAELKELFNFEFLKDKENVVIIGASGLGKTTLLKNLVHEAAKRGHSAIFIEAAELLDELASSDDRQSRRRMIEKYAKCELLGIDEVGYLSYEAEYADLLFQIIQKRSGLSSTALTTNRDFGEWAQIFPNPASVSALIDRLIEKCTTVRISGNSYRAQIQKLHQENKKLRSKEQSQAKTTPK